MALLLTVSYALIVLALVPWLGLWLETTADCNPPEP